MDFADSSNGTHTNQLHYDSSLNKQNYYTDCFVSSVVSSAVLVSLITMSCFNRISTSKLHSLLQNVQRMSVFIEAVIAYTRSIGQEKVRFFALFNLIYLFV